MIEEVQCLLLSCFVILRVYYIKNLVVMNMQKNNQTVISRYSKILFCNGVKVALPSIS